METPTLRLLAVRILSQTVSSSPCERNWSTFSLIHTQRRNRMGYDKLKKLVYCYYNMRLRERLLRDENREPEDPLDLMAIGQYAHLEEDDSREDPLYEWLRSDDLDGQDGGPAEIIAQEIREQGVDVEEVLRRERTPDEAFDPLCRSQTQSVGRGAFFSQQLSSGSSSSRTRSRGNDGDGDDDDDDDDGGTGGDGGGGTSCPQSQRPYTPFTCEGEYTHATQDEDHGARPPVRQYERRSTGRKGKAPVEADTLTDTMGSIDLSGSGQWSSYDHGNVLPYQGSEDYGFRPLRFPHEMYQHASQLPYGYSSSDYPDSGADSSTSYNFFGGVYPYGQMPYEFEPQRQQDDDELEEPARHSTWY